MARKVVKTELFAPVCDENFAAVALYGHFGPQDASWYLKNRGKLERLDPNVAGRDPNECSDRELFEGYVHRLFLVRRTVEFPHSRVHADGTEEHRDVLEIDTAYDAESPWSRAEIAEPQPPVEG